MILNIYCLILLAFACWFVLLSSSNVIYFRISRRKSRLKKGPKISVLIPARNEAKRIGPTLDALMKQDYADFEVIVIDDNSTDTTLEILESCAEKHERLEVLQGAELPGGWKGKPFAMVQLAERAIGDILVFLDADVVPKRDFLSWVADRMLSLSADSMSAYIRHRAKSVREYTFFSVMYMLNMALLPFWLIRCTRTPLFSHAVGQLFVFTRKAYDGVGGFGVVSDAILEDLQMGRAVKKAGYNHVFLDARNVLEGYMYDSWEHTISGIRRSVYEYFDKKTYPLVIVSICVLGFMVLPAVCIPLAILGSWSQTPWILAGNLGILVGWCITLYDRKMPWYVPFFYPIQFMFAVILSWVSVMDEVTGRGYHWKNRTVL